MVQLVGACDHVFVRHLVAIRPNGGCSKVTELSEQRVAQGIPALLFADDGGREGA
jgi:hypothetical protein